MKNFNFIFVLLMLSISIFAQTTPPTIQWQKSLGGTDVDYAYSIQQTNDGEFIIAGSTYSNDGDVSGQKGGIDYWVVKLDSTGNIQWQKCLGGTGIDKAYSIQQTNDWGYIVAGSSGSNNGDVTGNHGFDDYWVVKLDSIGNIQWQKSLGGIHSEGANSIRQTNDGGYIVAGYTCSNDGDVSGNHGGFEDYWVVKLDSSGNIQWQKCYGGMNGDAASSIAQTADGGYIVGGSSDSNDSYVTGNHGGNDIWIIKINSAGSIKWEKCLGGSGQDFLYSLQLTNDNGYILVGFSKSIDGDVTGNHGYEDYWVVKLDSSGNIQWQKSLGGTNADYGYSIQQTNDGGYIVAGSSFSNDGDVTGHHGLTNYYDYWIVKLDSSGNIQWQKSLGGSQDDRGFSIQQTNDGGFIATGQSKSNDGDVTGHHGTTSYDDIWIVKLSPPSLSINEQIIASNILIYPNPSNSNFTIKVTPKTRYVQISNSLGQVIEERTVTNQTELQFEIKNNGIYFVQITTDKEIITKKVMINN